MAKELTEHERGQIAALFKEGMSRRKIAIKIRRSKCAVDYYLANPEEENRKKRSGRPPKVSPRDQRRILRCATNTGTSATKIKTTLQLPYHPSTVKRVLKKSPNHKYTKRIAKPPLKPEHKQARLDWARNHMEFGVQWRKVVWSDEKKFNLDGPDGLQYYWHDLRKEPELFSKNAMGGGSVMIWAGFGWNGKTDMAFIDGRMNASGYQTMLEEYLLPKGVEIGGQNWMFQQDNASIHNAKSTKEWFTSRNVEVMKWPARSPDLNPIENLWGILVRRVYADGRQFETVGDLKASIQEEWTKIEAEVLEKLINSMQNRVFNVILKNGGQTKY
jgi:transposase